MRHFHIRGRRQRCAAREEAVMDALAMRSMFGGRHGADRESFGDDPGRGRGFPGGRGGWGMGPGGRGGGSGGMHARRKRLFDQAELQVLLLALIAEQPRHGYDLIREIESLSGGEYAPSPGVVYPALSYMEESGLIAPIAEQSARKAFEATEQGREKVASDAESAAALKERLSALADHRDRVDPAPVRRAMHALKTSVFDRLAHGGADRALILEIADAIDEATRKIERIER